MKKNIIAALVGLMMVSAAMASEDSVKKLLADKFPQLKVESVSFVEDVKLYEVLIKNEKGIALPTYTNENIDFLMLATGELLSTKTKKNVTLDREISRTKAIFNSLPFNESFSIKYGTGERKIAVFSDPDCPFCQEMEKDFTANMKKENVTVYYFMNPLTSLHPQAADRAKKILCDANPAKAWSNYTVNAPGLNQKLAATFDPDKFLPKNPGTCSKASFVQKQYDAATKFGFYSTPTIMFDNGYIVRDRIKVEQVIAVLNKRK